MKLGGGCQDPQGALNVIYVGPICGYLGSIQFLGGRGWSLILEFRVDSV